MKYQQPKFSVAMPGGSDWPFEAAQERESDKRECGECGALRVPGTAHLDQRDVDAKRPRKRVCLGKVIAG